MVPVSIPGKGNGFYPFPGGSPYNTAIAIGRLGVSVQFLGKLSKDFFGELLFQRLVHNNVRTDFISRSPENSTLAFVNLEENREPQYVFYTSNTADMMLVKNDLPSRLPEELHCILFGSIAMAVEPAASTIESFVLHQKDRLVISFDPNIRPFMIGNKEMYIKRLKKWLTCSTIIKISAADLSFIYEGLSFEESLQQILDMGSSLVVVTMGAEGSIAVLHREDGSFIRVKAPVVELPVVDTIGAGDTFHGAFLSWLELNGKMSHPALASLSEQELYEALYFANKAASIVCSKQGAEPPVMDEVTMLQ
jgi:fructokinase